MENQAFQEEQHLFLAFGDDAFGEVLELEHCFHLRLVVKVLIGKNQVIVLCSLNDMVVQVAQVPSYVIEVDNELEVGFNQKDEQLEKLLNLPAGFLVNLRFFVYL